MIPLLHRPGNVWRWYLVSHEMSSLKVLEVPGKSPIDSYIVMLHGYGATAEDLAPLAEEVAVPEHTSWLFVEAPIAIPFGPHRIGKAWFPIDIENLPTIDYSKIYPPGLLEASHQIMGLLKKLPVPLERILLGGFSQGSMVACEVVLQLQQNLAGLIILSGTLLDEARWTELAKKKKGLSYFISHGKEDPLLNYNAAVHLEKIFQQCGLLGQLQLFEGGHSIPFSVIHALQKYIQKALS